MIQCRVWPESNIINIMWFLSNYLFYKLYLIKYYLSSGDVPWHLGNRGDQSRSFGRRLSQIFFLQIFCDCSHFLLALVSTANKHVAIGFHVFPSLKQTNKIKNSLLFLSINLLGLFIYCTMYIHVSRNNFRNDRNLCRILIPFSH